MSDRRTGIAVYEDTNFTVGETLRVLDFETDLGEAATRGYIACDGVGNLTVELAAGPLAGYGSAFTMKQGEVFDFEGLIVSKLRLTHTGTDSAYRCHVA